VWEQARAALLPRVRAGREPHGTLVSAYNMLWATKRAAWDVIDPLPQVIDR